MDCFRLPKFVLMFVVIGLFYTGVIDAADNETKTLDELVIEAPKAEIRDIFMISCKYQHPKLR